MPDQPFDPQTSTTAPAGARRLMEATERRLGYLPDAVARLAASPELLGAFLRASALFEEATLDPLAREVVVMTIAQRTDCRVCRAMHTARLQALDAGPAIVEGLRTDGPLGDERLAAVRTFTVDVIEASGRPDPAALQSFLDAGHTARNALEVVLGIGAYTMSTFANRMVGARVDEPLGADA